MTVLVWKYTYCLPQKIQNHFCCIKHCITNLAFCVCLSSVWGRWVNWWPSVGLTIRPLVWPPCGWRRRSPRCPSLKTLNCDTHVRPESPSGFILLSVKAHAAAAGQRHEWTNSDQLSLTIQHNEPINTLHGTQSVTQSLNIHEGFLWRRNKPNDSVKCIFKRSPWTVSNIENETFSSYSVQSFPRSENRWNTSL